MKNLILDFFFFGHEPRFPSTACSNNVKVKQYCSTSLEAIIVLPVSVAIIYQLRYQGPEKHSLSNYVKK